MTDGDERRYNAREAATLIGCSASTVLTHASRLLGPRRRPSAHCRLTLTQVDQIRQTVAANRREVSDGDARRYNAREAAELLGVRRETVIDHAHRLFGPRRSPGTPFRLTPEQVELIGQAIDKRRRAPVYATRTIDPS